VFGESKLIAVMTSSAGAHAQRLNRFGSPR